MCGVEATWWEHRNVSPTLERAESADTARAQTTLPLPHTHPAAATPLPSIVDKSESEIQIPDFRTKMAVTKITWVVCEGNVSIFDVFDFIHCRRQMLPDCKLFMDGGKPQREAIGCRPSGDVTWVWKVQSTLFQALVWATIASCQSQEYKHEQHQHFSQMSWCHLLWSCQPSAINWSRTSVWVSDGRPSPGPCAQIKPDVVRIRTLFFSFLWQNPCGKLPAEISVSQALPRGRYV